MAIQNLTIIAAFGAAGAVARHLTNIALATPGGSRFPFATLAVNIAGCFFLGVAMHIAEQHPRALSETTHVALSTGFLGALTTFSTFGYETLHFLETDRVALAALNVIANLSLGLLAAWGGGQVGRAFG